MKHLLTPTLAILICAASSSFAAGPAETKSSAPALTPVASTASASATTANATAPSKGVAKSTVAKSAQKRHKKS